MRHELIQAVTYISSVPAGTEHLYIHGEFGKELAACTTGQTVLLPLAIYGDAPEVPMPLAHGLHNGAPLGTDGASERRILNVAASIDRAVPAFQLRPDREMGIWRV